VHEGADVLRPWCRDCRETKQFLDTHGIAYTEIDIEADPAASDEVLRHVGKRAIPQLVIDGEWFQPYKPGGAGCSTTSWMSVRYSIKTRL
jgi:glutaredoxin